MKSGTKVFLTILAITVIVWVLRGLGVLTFIPGIMIWLLILLTFATGIINGLQRAR